MLLYDSVLFDLDGTLLDTLQDLAESTNYALVSSGFPARSLEEIRAFVGNGVARLIHLAVPDGTSEFCEERCLALFRHYYLDHMSCKTEPHPGIRELLTALQQSGCRIGVVSNKFDGAVKGALQAHADILCCHRRAGRHPKKAGSRSGGVPLQCLDAGSGTCTVYVGISDVDIRRLKWQDSVFLSPGVS
ncbi:MAG: HAD family hydrolase [Intestinimonas sp.]